MKNTKKKITAHQVLTVLAIIGMLLTVGVGIYSYLVTGHAGNVPYLLVTNTALFCSIIALNEDSKKKAKAKEAEQA